MAWVSLTERAALLPLVLAGPIVRRTEPGTVSVWLALKDSCVVTLRIYEKYEDGQLHERFAGTQQTVRLGDNLHLVTVTAQAGTSQPLAWGEKYYYDLFFSLTGQEAALADVPHLNSPGILVQEPAENPLCYPGEPLPSFVLPAAELNRVRMIHGSCRRAHGSGQDSLGYLDTLLTNTINDSAQRPQQLFLTGDQIYVDNVATPLLLLLIDASRFLFAGNQEEVLPDINILASTLAPGTRRDVVLNKARFTTSTPYNHLLSLAEYSAMYLFAWSEQLWPAELPDLDTLWQFYPEVRSYYIEKERERLQYTAMLERLNSFRATLPQARRALANISTYMICDDHEITDDWYLDGAWCQRVLDAPLGRRVIRNAVLAYALFQAWGNTPEQFAAASGARLLETLSVWRGEEDGQVNDTLNELLLPITVPDHGSLVFAPEALHWHYSYDAVNYQILVLDTRTQRLYRAPQDFPGLLSPKALHDQVSAVHRGDVPVTFIVSATPVLGIDFIESIQFWSRWRVRDNYAYDREAWALEWGSFQQFLKISSAMQRVVILSGDVHYAFAASLQYWDHKTRATAKFVNYTASPQLNEGSGSHIAVLAVGYPHLQRRLWYKGQNSIDFFAWDVGESGEHHFLDYMLTVIRKQLYRFWWSIPRLIAVRRSPVEIVLPAWGWLKGAFDAFPPDRSYRLSYLRNSLYNPTAPKGPIMQDSVRGFISRTFIKLAHVALANITLLGSALLKLRNVLQGQQKAIKEQPRLLQQSTQALSDTAIEGTERISHSVEKRRMRLVDTILHYEQWLDKWKASELIVGYNNLGEISFEWDDKQQAVCQRLWYARPNEEGMPVLTSTTYSETLQLPTPEAEPPLP